jgi:hypothetical protein
MKLILLLYQRIEMYLIVGCINLLLEYFIKSFRNISYSGYQSNHE